MSPEVIVEAAGPLGDAPSRPIKAFYNLCGYDPSEESPILLSWIGDFFLSGGLPKMATCSESKQFTVCNHNAKFVQMCIWHNKKHVVRNQIRGCKAKWNVSPSAR